MVQLCHIITYFKYEEDLNQILVPNRNSIDKESEVRTWSDQNGAPKDQTASKTSQQAVGLRIQLPLSLLLATSMADGDFK